MEPKKVSFADVLRGLLEKKDVTQDELAGKLELSGAYINRLVTGRQKPPSLDRCKQISGSLGLTPEEGKILFETALVERLPGEFQFLLEGIEQTVKLQEWEDKDTPPIYVIEYSEAGGEPIKDDRGFPLWEGRLTIGRPRELNDMQAFALRVHGNEMSPAIEEGWLIIVAPSHQVKNKDFVLVKDKSDNVKLKKIQFNGEVILLYSVNSAYPPETYQKRDLKFIHKVWAILPR